MYRAAQESGTFIAWTWRSTRSPPDDPPVHGAARRGGVRDLEAGIVLRAYLPVADALVELAEWARSRSTPSDPPGQGREPLDGEGRGGEPRWEQAPYATKHEVDANYIRLLDYILTPSTPALRSASPATTSTRYPGLGLATPGVTGRSTQMLQGMAPAQQQAVRDVVGRRSSHLGRPPRGFRRRRPYLVRRSRRTPRRELPPRSVRRATG